MTIKYNRQKAASLKYSKIKTKKIGIKSISDIINNTPELSFKEKVNYIRHHYTYYNGNYEFFHTNTGSPNAKKYKLNNVIAEVINGKKDPCVLKDFNAQILQWRKERNKQLEEEELLKLVKMEPKYEYTEELPFWKKQIEHNLKTNQYVQVIEDYLNSSSNSLTKEEIEKKSYRELKDLAVAWKLEQYDGNSVFSMQAVDTVIKNKLEKLQQKEDKRIYNLMKEYARDLGYDVTGVAKC